MVVLASALSTAAWAQELGRVHFETSCTPQAQEKFDRGLAMVHSFVYPDSVQAFTEAAAADPQCAIPYWGIAISSRPNPLVLPLTAAALKKGLEAVEKGKAIGAKTERERDWLAAIELYYKDYDKVDQTTRGLAYEKAMEQLMQKYPDDVEAATFYALALNETALPTDRTYANQLKAGAILEKVLAAQPAHPGVLHYLIHSYDYAPLAQRGLDAANKYASIAPDAPHALHMPAHTYSMLGLWVQSVESNTKSRASAQAQAARLWPGAAHPSEPLAYLLNSAAWQKLAGEPTGPAAEAAISPEGLAICSAMGSLAESGDWAALDPDFAAGKRALAAGDWQGAINTLTAAGLRDDRNADIQNYLGYAYGNLQQLDAATQHYQRALSLDSRHRSAHAHLGQAYLLQGSLVKAEEHFAALERICLIPCAEYGELKRAIARYAKVAKR
jgi:tetratricopeptide (TPR) repeat protein